MLVQANLGGHHEGPRRTAYGLLEAGSLIDNVPTPDRVPIQFLSNFFRPRDSFAVSVGNKPHTFKGGTIVAQTEWEPQQRDGSRMAVGYTSYRGDLVPVYDLAAKLGFGSCRSPLIAIVATEAGYVAFIVKELVKSDERSNTTIDLDDLFGGPQYAA